MTTLSAALFGLAAGWVAPAVVTQWIGTASTSLRLVSALASAAAFAVAAEIPAGDAFAALSYWCLCLALVDYSCRRLPNALTVSGGAAVLVAAAWDGLGVAAVTGAVLLATLYAAANVASRGGLGAGDVKLAVPLGAFAATAGGTAWWAAAALAPMGTVALAVTVRPKDRGVPHGPSMCAATLVAWVCLGA